MPGASRGSCSGLSIGTRLGPGDFPDGPQGVDEGQKEQKNATQDECSFELRARHRNGRQTRRCPPTRVGTRKIVKTTWEGQSSATEADYGLPTLEGNLVWSTRRMEGAYATSTAIGPLEISSRPVYPRDRMDHGPNVFGHGTRQVDCRRIAAASVALCGTGAADLDWEVLGISRVVSCAPVLLGVPSIYPSRSDGGGGGGGGVVRIWALPVSSCTLSLVSATLGGSSDTERRYAACAVPCLLVCSRLGTRPPFTSETRRRNGAQNASLGLGRRGIGPTADFWSFFFFFLITAHNSITTSPTASD